MTRIDWSEDTLIFMIVEHEDGRTIESSETWSIGSDGGIRKRVLLNSKTEGG